MMAKSWARMVTLQLPPALLARTAAVRELAQRHQNILFFSGGFLFDLLTLNRIDAWLDLLTQGLYLSALTAIILLQARRQLGVWSPRGRVIRLWAYNLEALHFFYGGLLSAYVVFYSKSSSGARSGVFLFFIVCLMIANEMPQVRAAGTRLRLGLYAFCVASYLNYLLPVLLGRMGAGIFSAALILALAASAALVYALAGYAEAAEPGKVLEPSAEPAAPGRRWPAIGPPRLQACLGLGGPPAAVLAILAALYFLKWIPPVPLSLKYAGIYHKVERTGAGYALTYQKPPWFLFWRRDDRRFLARAQDSVYCFVRVFAPTRFSHRVFLHWRRKDERSGRFLTADRIPLPIAGGRGEGYRGFAVKSRWQAGRWRVDVETEDGRVIGEVSFRVLEDSFSRPRAWRQREM